MALRAPPPLPNPHAVWPTPVRQQLQLTLIAKRVAFFALLAFGLLVFGAAAIPVAKAVHQRVSAALL